MSVRVVTLNLRYGSADDGENSWPQRRDLLVGTVRALDPDILSTQEGLPFQLEELDAALPSMKRVGLGRYHGVSVDRQHEAFSGEHCAVYFRLPRFQLIDHRTSWLSETPDEPGGTGWGAHLARVVTRVLVHDVETDTRCAILNTHFHWGEQITAGSVQCLKREIAGLPWGASPSEGMSVIVTGDFNLDPSSPEHAALLSHELPDGRYLVDAWEQARAGGTAQTSCGGWEPAEAARPPREGGSAEGTSHGFSGMPSRRIDWILVSDDLHCTRARIDHANADGRYVSDHFPVAAELEAGG